MTTLLPKLALADAASPPSNVRTCGGVASAAVCAVAAVASASQALVALGAAADESASSLRAEIEAFDALANRAQDLASQLARSEQQHAAATAVVAERVATCDAAARAVLATEAIAAVEAQATVD